MVERINLKIYTSLAVIFTILFVAISCNSNENKLTLRIEVNGYKVGENENIYIAGNHNKLGNWNPAGFKMERKSDTSFVANLSFDSPIDLSFKFTRGSWETEAVTPQGVIHQDHVVSLVSDTVVSFDLVEWKDYKHEYLGQVTGQVEQHLIEAEKISDRTISVWLPPTYNDNEETRFPVVYVQDGQNAFDPSTANFGFDWALDETADSLIRNGLTKAFIMVAIPSDSDYRGAEYSDSSRGALYRKYLIERVKSFVDENYRTLTDANNTAVLGSSMGGLFSFISVWEHNDHFTMGACFSPAFKYKKYDYTKIVEETDHNNLNLNLYIDNGGLGLEKVLQPGIDDMMAILDKKGIDYSWHLFPDDKHDEHAWKSRAHIPLIQFFGKK